jgi:hypothetical protein
MFLLSAAAMAMAGGYPYPLDPKQSQEARDIWKGLQDGKQHGQILIDRLVWRSLHGSDAPTIVTVDDARRFTQGCSVVRTDQEAPESLAYELNCNGQTKYIYFAASDGSIIMADIDNNPSKIRVVPNP